MQKHPWRRGRAGREAASEASPDCDPPLGGAMAHGDGSGVLPAALLLPVLGIVLALAAVVGVGLATARGLALSDYFFLYQDAAPLCLGLVFLFVLRVIALPRHMGPALPPAVILGAGVAFVLVVGALGWPLVFDRYPLSMDEFWAEFDTAIFKRGGWLAPVRPEWRDYVPALQPLWRLETLGDRFWGSTYLPLNAAFRAGFARLGLKGFSSPAFAAVGCLATYGVARRLWPSERAAALVALLMLATSSQLLITAMTPYAMSAHFGLDMAWLWLFTRDRAWGFAGAAGLGILACGLHQLVFHLLFAAPFLLELWLARRWRPALALTVAYAGIAGFWMCWWTVQMAAAGALPAAHTGAGAGFFLQRLTVLTKMVEPRGAFLMAENGLRFIAWQNPLCVPLAILGALSAWRAPAMLRPLVVGVVLTLAATALLIPNQGHGWGYRYLHGLLGSFALLAAAGAMRLPQVVQGRPAWRAGGGVLAASVAVSLLVLLPWRAAQARGFALPYERALQAIARDKADVVLVDPTGLWFGADLVRNDPFLEARPKVMLLSELTPDSIRRLCRVATVSLFEARQGLAAGLHRVGEVRTSELTLKRGLIAAPPCRSAPAAPERPSG